jgi:hypothetical protein
MKKNWSFDLILAVLLAAFLLVAYGHAFQLAFINDDYFFLEKVRGRTLWQLWLPEDLILNWYRPWSRETHYWVLNHLAGLNEPVYHLANFPLALAVLLLFFQLANHLAGRGTAGIATAAVASLALWSGPVLWVPGAQELWMLLFSLLSLHAVLAGRTFLALIPLLMALLSKETAAILPALATAALWILKGRPLRTALARTAGFWIVTATWAIMHPTLRARIFGTLQGSPEAEHRAAAPVVLLKTLLAQVNLDGVFAPEGGWGPVLLNGLAGGVILCVLVWLALGFAPGDPPGSEVRPSQTRVVAFGCGWAILGFAILFLPSIGWHAYYGVIGSLGLWLAIGVWLGRHRRLALAVVLALALAREARAATPSWDWGTDWYQTRAGTMLAAIRRRLSQFHPSFPAHSRLYFARLPNQIGLLAGDGPAIRIWYDDPTLEGHYYSAYSPGVGPESAGLDFFFRFDTAQVLVEIHPGPELLPEAAAANPGWQRDHEILAAMFIRTGNITGAATEYGKLATALPGRADYALHAGAAYEAIGASSEANAFYLQASRVFGAPNVRRRAVELIRALPPRAR